MKTKVLVTLALIVAYLIMAIFRVNQQVMAPVMCRSQDRRVGKDRRTG